MNLVIPPASLKPNSDSHPYLEDCPVFEGFSCDEARKLGYIVVEKQFKPKSLIFAADSKAEYVYLVREGRVKLFRQTEDGRETIVTILGPGDVFGEFVFGETVCHSVYAEAFGPALICILPSRRFLQLLMTEPEIAVRILTNVGRRLSRSAFFIENLSTYNIRLRFAKLLMCLVEEHGKDQLTDVALNLKLTHQDLANMIATCRQTATELINYFKNYGILSNVGKTLVVHRPQLHRALAEWQRLVG